MKLIYTSVILLILSLGLIHQTNSQCVDILKCFHQGVLNTKTCSCECFPSYSGKQCEIPRCHIQSKDCDTISIDLCSNLLVFEYCPARCKADFCDSTTIASTTSTATKPTTTITTTTTPTPAPPTACTNIDCLNGGTFDITSCNCKCFAAYSGPRCENLDCSQQPDGCSRFVPALCGSDSIKYFCPVMCGLCNNTSTTSSSPTITESNSNATPIVSNSTLFPSTTISTIGQTSSPAAPTACTNIDCLNGGTFDITSCNCKCFTAYSGPRCENLDCSQQPDGCSRFVPALCGSDSIKYFCPVMCGLCNNTITMSPSPIITESNSNSTAFQSTTPTPAPPTACTNIDCLNGGTFDITSCNCKCFTAYSGPRCENLDCSQQPAGCSRFVPALCDSDSIKYFCPVMCGLCNNTITMSPSPIITESNSNSTAFPSTTPTPAPPTACTNIDCLNGGTFDITSCSCKCFAAYSGPRCENLDCSQQPAGCSRFVPALCDSDSIKYFCPVMCGLCNNTITMSPSPIITESNSNSTAFPSTTPTPAPPTACTNIDCLNGGTFDITSCSCKCFAAYSGPRCENLDCSQQPAGCSRFVPALCDSDSIKYFCPVMCGLCNNTSVVKDSKQMWLSNDGINLASGISLILTLQFILFTIIF